jgi:transcriptional regulator with XRE-family HTH domain
LTFEIRFEAKDRRVRRVTVRRLAVLTGYSPSHISRVIRGASRASVRCLTAIGEILNMDISEVQDAIDNRRIIKK